MSQLLRNNWSYLKLIMITSRVQRKALSDTMTMQQSKAIGELAANILYGVLPISTHYKKKLHRYKTFITQLADRRTSQRQRQQLIQQYPAVLVLLIKIAQPTIQNILCSK